MTSICEEFAQAAASFEINTHKRDNTGLPIVPNGMNRKSRQVAPLGAADKKIANMERGRIAG